MMFQVVIPYHGLVSAIGQNAVYRNLPRDAGPIPEVLRENYNFAVAIKMRLHFKGAMNLIDSTNMYTISTYFPTWMQSTLGRLQRRGFIHVYSRELWCDVIRSTSLTYQKIINKILIHSLRKESLLENFVSDFLMLRRTATEPEATSDNYRPFVKLIKPRNVMHETPQVWRTAFERAVLRKERKKRNARAKARALRDKAWRSQLATTATGDCTVFYDNTPF